MSYALIKFERGLPFWLNSQFLSAMKVKISPSTVTV